MSREFISARSFYRLHVDGALRPFHNAITTVPELDKIQRELDEGTRNSRLGGHAHGESQERARLRVDVRVLVLLVKDVANGVVASRIRDGAIGTMDRGHAERIRVRQRRTTELPRNGDSCRVIGRERPDQRKLHVKPRAGRKARRTAFAVDIRLDARELRELEVREAAVLAEHGGEAGQVREDKHRILCRKISANETANEDGRHEPRWQANAAS